MMLDVHHSREAVCAMSTDGIGTRSSEADALAPATVEAARTGDRAAWTIVVARYQVLILSIFLGYAITHSRAKEMCQEVWLKLYLRARNGLIEVLSLPGLPIREARYRAIDELRGQRRAGQTAPLSSVTLPSLEPSAEEQASRRSELFQARRMLRALPKRQRQVMLLAAVRGTPHAEVAQMLGISTARAKQTLSDARARLRRIRQMPTPTREAYLLVTADGLSPQAVVERLGIPHTVVQDHLLSARQHIQHGGAR